MTSERTPRPDGIDAEGYVESLFGVDGSADAVKYQLRFDPVLARYIRERIWHPSQRLRARVLAALGATLVRQYAGSARAELGPQMSRLSR